MGLSREQLASTAGGEAGDRVWPPAARAVFRLADELHERSGVGEALFSELRRHFSAAQILELVVTAGWYHTIAYVIDAARVAPEPWAERLPAA